ncbi:tumor necrosis factor receptor superfamily member 16 isoform X1 [Chiloscyllium plagiosum]|uniref:tumor necrosis factor receptor superfamily member 16 isoform X1 n=1 Tax=Chiloscyllium plagiosum TaxID=36176 RepID=UPI001CB81F19|nr:tumor necrosis factor receptor superfamily member 16 isoform X1 [Chiloscyllium plagiosum]
MRFLFCLLFISQVLADDSCPSGQFTLQGDCCDFCPVGHGIIKECNITNTQCQPCEDGVTFSPSASFSHCQPCSSCPDKMEVVSLCTATFDIQCQCMEGYYLQPGSRSCSQGFQMLEKCRRDKNVKCELCPEGSSEKASNSQPCAPCRVCDKDEFVLQECQRTSDTVCLSKNSSLLRPQVEPVRDDAKFVNPVEPASGTVNFTAHDTGKNIIPVYFSILAAVIMGLVIYVTVKCWNTCEQKKQLAKARAGELDTGPEGEKLHGDSGVFVDTHSLHEPQLSKVVCADPSVYSKLPLQKRQEVEQLLESQDDSRADWRSLACHLGYDEERVATIGRGEDPAHTLLSDWSMRDNGNLDVLCKALRRVEREDIVECLKSESAVTSLV